MSNIFTIPAGIPFSKALAAQLLKEHQETPEELADILILLPTRRACRTLRDAFLQENEGKPIILPTLQAIGDIDEEELSLSIMATNTQDDFLNLPPTLPTIQRRVMLARAIIKHKDFPYGFDQALNLAKALGQLLDQIYTENLDIKNLADLVPEDFANHWQVTLDFLKILSDVWPDILNDLGVIDAANRRNQLINTLNNFWQKNPPKRRIIAAGTTGSIPAVAHLLKTISNLPNGQIILPGLDQHIDDDSWKTIEEAHPQYGFKHLLNIMDAKRKHVKIWPSPINDNTIAKERRIMACELMRPAETSKEWQNLKDNAFKKAIENLKILECETSQNEAQIIATYMRQTLEEPTKTAALITPDRNLAKRVATACKKWNIEIDDSAGTPLSQTPIGQFLLLSITTIDEHLSPVSLLSLLKHPLTHHDFQNNLNHLEINILRGFKPTKGIQGLKNKLAKQSLDSSENDILQKQINALESAFEPCLNLIENDEKTEFKIILTKHIQLCETLHNHDQLWSNEDGNKASTILAKLLEQSHTFPPIQPKEYSKILQQFLDEATIRPAYGTHPRLQILGQLEARLIDADLVILGGLNEGTWPPEPSHDPWMSRPMRKNFGLPTSERSIGLSAHDFVQALCTSNVVITRSKLQDGAPTVPARWLGRLETVLSAAKTPISPLKESIIQNWVDDMHNAHTLKPFTRPAPKPPLKARPQKLSVTKIETWLKNPYAIYAHSILNLKTLDPLEKAADAALKGQMLHNALDHFITHNKDEIPKNAAKQILNNAQEYCANETQDEEEWYFYWPKFETITDQFLIKEHQWRDIAKPFKTEINGQIAIQAKSSQFTLYGRADRIDKKESGVAIIDYKSGGNYQKKSIEHGDNPQLPLEALIAQDGGFENIPPLPCTYLGYWVLNGTTPVELENIDDMLVDTKAALIALIDTFNNPNTPYYAIPRATKIPRFDDYAHLARIKEWAALDDADSEAAA